LRVSWPIVAVAKAILSTMIGKDSPLRLLPNGLDRKQALYLDGIRHAVEIADLAFRRLCACLAHIASHGHENGETAHAFADAWTFVDAVDRFRTLMHMFPPRIDLEGPPTRAEFDFAARLAELRNLRNVADHIAQRVDYVLAKRMPILGALSWFATDADMEGGRVFMLAPGSIIGKSTMGVVNPAGRELTLLHGTGVVTLSAGEYQLCLSEVHESLEVEVRRLEAAIRAQTTGHDHSASDVLVTVVIKWNKDLLADQPRSVTPTRPQ
jgi:hypothetical protein